MDPFLSDEPAYSRLVPRTHPLAADPLISRIDTSPAFLPEIFSPDPAVLQDYAKNIFSQTMRDPNHLPFPCPRYFPVRENIRDEEDILGGIGLADLPRIYSGISCRSVARFQRNIASGMFPNSSFRQSKFVKIFVSEHVDEARPIFVYRIFGRRSCFRKKRKMRRSLVLVVRKRQRKRDDAL